MLEIGTQVIFNDFSNEYKKIIGKGYNYTEEKWFYQVEDSNTLYDESDLIVVDPLTTKTPWTLWEYYDDGWRLLNYSYSRPAWEDYRRNPSV